MNQRKIILLDGFGDRAENMLKAFEGLCDRYQLSFYKGRKKIVNIDLEESSDEDHSFLIFLVHGNDHVPADTTNFKIRVWYGGDGGEGLTSRGENEYKIKRRIVNRDFLTSTEAQQLIHFAEGKIKKPSFLLSNENRQGINLAIEIYNLLQTPEGIKNLKQLEQYDEKMKQFPPLNKPYKKLKKELFNHENQGGLSSFFNTEHMRILNQFRDSINNEEKKL